MSQHLCLAFDFSKELMCFLTIILIRQIYLLRNTMQGECHSDIYHAQHSINCIFLNTINPNTTVDNFITHLVDFNIVGRVTIIECHAVLAINPAVCTGLKKRFNFCKSCMRTSSHPSPGLLPTLAPPPIPLAVPSLVRCARFLSGGRNSWRNFYRCYRFFFFFLAKCKVTRKWNLQRRLEALCSPIICPSGTTVAISVSVEAEGLSANTVQLSTLTQGTDCVFMVYAFLRVQHLKRPNVPLLIVKVVKLLVQTPLQNVQIASTLWTNQGTGALSVPSF